MLNRIYTFNRWPQLNASVSGIFYRLPLDRLIRSAIVKIAGHRRIWFFIVTCLAGSVIFIFCSGAGSWQRQIIWPDVDRAHLPTAADYPDEGAIFLLDEGTNEIVRGDEIAFSQMDRHRIIKIFNERGYQFANVVIPYGSSTVVTNIRGRTITADGRIIPLDTKKIFDVNLYPGFIFYSDIRAKRFTLSAIEKNCIIEYQWQATVSNFTYWDQWTFQNEVPTLLSRFRVNAPAEWEIKFKSVGLDIPPKGVKAPAGFKQSYEWEARDIPPWRSEPGMPPPQEIAAALVLSPVGVKNWGDIATWYHGLVKDRLQPDEAIEKKTAELTSSFNNDYQRLRAIYEFVRDQIRYVAISIGIGGYQPHDVRQIFHDRYGDCKDKAALLIAMASCAGIRVDPVLISTWYNARVDTTIATHTHFNHVIARSQLDDSTVIWMDSTEPFARFGELPWYDAGLWTFIVDQKGAGSWQQTPAIAAAQNSIQRIWHLRITEDGLCKGIFTMLFDGAPALETRDETWNLRQHEMRNWISRQVLARFPAATIDSLSCTPPSDLTQPLAFYAAFDFPLQSPIVRRSLSQFTAFDWHFLFPDSARQYPLQLKYAYRVIDSLQVDLSAAMKMLSIPAADSLVTPILDYRLTSGYGPNRAHIKRVLSLKRHTLAASEFAEFRRSLLHLADHDLEAQLIIQNQAHHSSDGR